MSKIKLPEDWQVVKLGDYCYRPEYGYTASAVDTPVGPKFLRITDIQHERVQWNEVPYCICEPDERRKYLLAPGDMVIARIGATTGKTFVLDNCPEAIFASYLIRIRTKPDLIPEFLGFCSQTESYWRQIDQNKGGRLKGGVNIPVLQSLEIPLPPRTASHRPYPPHCPTGQGSPPTRACP